MDYLLKMADEINRQEPQVGKGYRSLYSINGLPILPPLVGWVPFPLSSSICLFLPD